MKAIFIIAGKKRAMLSSLLEYLSLFIFAGIRNCFNGFNSAFIFVFLLFLAFFFLTAVFLKSVDKLFNQCRDLVDDVLDRR